ncbi:MAG: PHP domain-containing protein [Parcubacteria group bacterium Gr01-1014_38]|nr:MAG: PHP domain-containing protein [Parcubacteria group bacterium Gr01-1014_38]
MSAEAVVSKCIDEGVDVLAVTDHHEISGAQALQRRAPFQVIVGEEIRAAEGGEIIGLFLKEKISQGQHARDVVREIRAQGGLVYLPHPFDRIRTKQWPDALRAALLETADIMEVFNARSMTRTSERKAREAAERLGKVACVGADAHFPREIGPTAVLLPPFSTPESLLVSLRTARFRCQRSPRWVFPATKLVELLR